MPFIRRLICTGKAVSHNTGEAVRNSHCHPRSHRLHRPHHLNIATLCEHTEPLHRNAKETQVWGWTPHIFSKNKWTQKYNVPVKKKKKKKIGISVHVFFLSFFFVNTQYAELSSQAFSMSEFTGTLAIQPRFTA